eukprot:scaffold3337_cov169-Amphora_coffeaeformis.AAC.34
MHPNEMSDDDSDTGVPFASVDFSGVNFDQAEGSATPSPLTVWEESLAFQQFDWATKQDTETEHEEILETGKLLAVGKYAHVLRNKALSRLFKAVGTTASESSDTSVFDRIVASTTEQAGSTEEAFQLEMAGVAALNLFLQANYTGPALADTEGGMEAFADILPHAPLREVLKATEQGNTSITVTQKSSAFQNAVLAQLAVDGDWPCQVCEVPFFLLIARAIFDGLAVPTVPLAGGVHLWRSRALVAHQRLLQIREASATLAKSTDEAFAQCVTFFCVSDSSSADTINPRAATVLLEKGMADHHLERTGKGRKFFVQAQHQSGLQVEVTGATGKRTKFQQEATAQLLVRAKSTAANPETEEKKQEEKEIVKGQLIEHSEEEILLERIKFEDDKENEVLTLNTLDQSIVLALCLDVKNSNPTDGLTAEEMGAFLARVLDHHDDWMIYSTGLLERSWLEFERTHARERAILQMQALTDQHTNRLTITQSTTQSIEESAPVQDRLKNLHQIVYPPRWEIIQDLADRYASMGIVTSAAELYTEVELWDDVVSCYTRAGKKSKAEEIVRERLAIQETPRMWAALGDLTGKPEHYHKAVELSHGRFSHAYVCLGLFYFEKGDLEEAAKNYEAAVKVRPLSPNAWFRLGTICMRLKRWDTALKAFTEVVQQEPEEGDAWANVAAIHMHNKHSTEAYPALNEALKYQRYNWRIWVSKLYTCLDLEKYDEAIQACNTLMDLRDQRGASDNIPPLEEKCVRAIVGGTIQRFHDKRGDNGAMESVRRSLNRIHSLLERIHSSSQTEPWVLEALAFFHEQVGKDEKVLEYLMQEYRALQGIAGWEKDEFIVKKITDIVLHIMSIHKQEGTKEHITKARFLVRGVARRIQSVHIEKSSVPPEVARLEEALTDLESIVV